MADNKVCPFCGEEIPIKAIKCKYCETDLYAIRKKHSKADKRILALCFILALLVVLVLCRWNVWWDVDGGRVYQQDRLTSLIHIRQEHSRGHTTTYQNIYITYATTAVIYITMGGVLIALLFETKDH